jgi:hypothetical protein
LPSDDARLDRRGAIELAFKELERVERFQILLACAAKPSSTKMISPDRERLTAMAHHVRVLRDRGLIRQTRTAQVRGATETFYTATAAGRKLLQRLGVDTDAGA